MISSRGKVLDSPRAITKILLPRKRTHLLHRQRLVDFLHEHIERKLLLVSASAGYGKTSLLIDFAHDTTLPVCWYSLDSSDADPKTFFEYLLASLRRQFPNFGARTFSLLSEPAALRDIEVVVGTLVTEIQETIPNFFVIILDDYQSVEESDEINHIVDTLLRLLPETAHLILSSRTLPSKLTLTRLTARQEIAGLGVSDLRFTAEEVRALIRQNYQIDFSEQDAAQLAEDSEGWIAGILLTTHTLWQGLFQNLVRVQGTHSHVFNYLASEVLALQTPELQRFLVDTSILEQLDPAICNRLLGISNSAGILRIIEQKNLFIVRLDEANASYRYHHLFQEFLRTRLMESDVTRWLELNRRAATLFEEIRDWVPAISHYLKAQAYDEAARVLEQVAKETFDSGRWATLAKWIDALPGALLNRHPDLLVYRAMIYDEMGDRARAIETLERTALIYEQRGDTLGTARALIRQASCLRVQGRYQEAIQHCQRALELVSLEDKAEAADAHRIIGISYVMMGDLENGIGELELALRDYERLENLSRIALIHHDLGNAYVLAGRTESQQHFQQALDYWRRAGNLPGLANTLNSVGVGFYYQGLYARAIETLEQALIEARRCGQLRTEAPTLASLGDVYRDTGEYARAQQLYQTAYDIGRQINEGFVITYALDALGATFRLLGDLPTARRLVQQALEQAESHRSNYETGLAKISLGIIHYNQGDFNSAIANLESAIDLLERGGAKRDSARAHLHLAQVHYLQRNYRQMTEQLRITADLARQIGESQFAIADRRSLLPLIRYAAHKKIGDGYFAQLLEKIESMPMAPAEEHVEKPLAPRKHLIEARAFGTATVSVDGKLISKADWASASAKELFFLLLANTHGLSKEQILSALWGNISPAKASGIFHSTVYRIRRALSSNCLVYENGLYQINPELDLWYDVGAFNRLIAEARRTQSNDSRVQYWQEAMTLYRGDYFEDSYSDWTAPLRFELSSKYLDMLTALADHYAQHSKIEQAITVYQRILSKDSFREDVYRALMRLQFRAGDRGAALKTYQQCAETLRGEMGVEPSPETRQLFEQISISSGSS
jgi:LuxR family maltose regulon positive regulatory protein